MTMLDFPGRVACTVFTAGCNFRCPFCHNAPLVLPGQMPREVLSEEDFFAFLERRRGLLDGVAITGGEPLLQDVSPFLRRVKEMGFTVKLDTNGSSPARLRALLRENLVDYVAVDIKNSPEKYAATAGLPSLDLSFIRESIAILLEGRVDYEFRTTVVPGFHEEEDFPKMGKLIEGAERYFLQAFADSGDLVGGRATAGDIAAHPPFSREQMERFAAAASPYVKTVSLRGVD